MKHLILILLIISAFSCNNSHKKLPENQIITKRCVVYYIHSSSIDTIDANCYLDNSVYLTFGGSLHDGTYGIEVTSSWGEVLRKGWHPIYKVLDEVEHITIIGNKFQNPEIIIENKY